METSSMDDLVMKDLLQTNQELKNENKILRGHLNAPGTQSKIETILQSKYKNVLAEDDNSTEIIIVRHGQTEWNIIRKWQGQGNSPLTKVGLSGAKKVGKKLYSLHKNGMKIDFVYSSPLKRARRTAEIIMMQFVENGEKMQINFDDRIMERHYGDLQGMTKDEIKKNKAKIHEQMNEKMDYRPPGDGAESFLDVIDRTSEFIAEITAKHQGKRVLVVCHGGVLKGIFNDVLHSTTLERKFHPKNCAINIIERIHNRKKWFVSVLGDDEYGNFQTLDEVNDNESNEYNSYNLAYLVLGLVAGAFVGYNMRKIRR